MDTLVACVERILVSRKDIARGILEMFIVKLFPTLHVIIAKKVTRIMTHLGIIKEPHIMYISNSNKNYPA